MAANWLITEAVRDSIRKSDALIAFFTRRGEPIAEGKWNTHQWVRDELMSALENDKQVLEIYEDGVTRDAGLAGRDRQYLHYGGGTREDCVVNIVKSRGTGPRRGAPG